MATARVRGIESLTVDLLDGERQIAKEERASYSNCCADPFIFLVSVVKYLLRRGLLVKGTGTRAIGGERNPT
jgi:hypothetical protein